MIGENIKNLRKIANMTQDTLADKLNVTRQAISKWENNKGEPDLYMISNIATALEVSVENLLYGNRAVRIISVIQEKLPKVRFIGNRYNGSDYVIYSSDLIRTKHTPEIISSYLHAPPTFDERIREFNLGESVGKSKEWAKNNLSCPVWEGTIDWACTSDGQVFRNAETRRDVWNRVLQFSLRANELIFALICSIIKAKKGGNLRGSI